MNSHPGGAEHTRKLLDIAALPAGSRILDLGAGDGSTVSLLRALGYMADGIDLKPQVPLAWQEETNSHRENLPIVPKPLVQKGNLLATGYPDESFDAVLSECSFYVSGHVPQALAEAARILKPDGFLLWSDVFFDDPLPLLQEAGFSMLSLEDITPLWREYYLEAIWNGADVSCVPKGKCRYLALIAIKCAST
ncbi:MAG: class I SAM-dependent methyltransferase [Lachnospiraceae bacterium]|nr:class I SAM-dependent methyltransferase [Lachnospiraceae bacterium]